MSGSSPLRRFPFLRFGFFSPECQLHFGLRRRRLSFTLGDHGAVLYNVIQSDLIGLSESILDRRMYMIDMSDEYKMWHEQGHISSTI